MKSFNIWGGIFIVECKKCETKKNMRNKEEKQKDLWSIEQQ